MQSNMKSRLRHLGMSKHQPSRTPLRVPSVTGAERIQALDVIRGCALLGIFLMNIEFFARPLQDIDGEGIDSTLRGLNFVADAAVYFFVQGKFWTLFSLLFGMGFAVMIERAGRAGRAFLPTYLRRTLALLVIGTMHALLIWSGDILLSYALGALILLLARQLRRAQRYFRWQPPASMSARRLAVWGVSLYSLPLLILLVFGVIGSLNANVPRSPHELAAHAQQAAEKIAVRATAAHSYSDGTYAEAVQQRVLDTREQLDDLPVFLLFVLGVFLIGASIVRSGYLRDIKSHAAVFRTARNIGLSLGFALMAISLSGGSSLSSDHFQLSNAIGVITYLMAGLILALAYGATIVTALNSRLGPWLQAWIAPAGRMALTNYLSQSLIGTMIFYHYGFGFWGQIGRAAQVGVVLAIYSLQLLFSRCWLARFDYGPMEWLWRAITYWQWPIMRRALQ